MNTKQNIIYIRGIKRLKNTVLCVDSNDQKTYYDPISKTRVGFSSGAQVKRCVREKMVENLGKTLSKVTINYLIDGNGILKQSTAEVNSNPLNLDSLVFGWMITSSKKETKSKKNSSDEDDSSDETKNVNTEGVTKASAVSISPLTPLHPFLTSIKKGDLQTLDRLDNIETCKINIFKETGKNKSVQLTDEEIKNFLNEKNRMMPKAIYTSKSKIDGIFSFDFAIDLRTLFSVQVNGYKTQVTKETEKELVKNGWKYGKNEFGEILLAPKEVRENAIEALCDALVDWQFKTNQSSNFSPSVTDAISVSFDVRKASNAISAEVFDREASAVIDPDYVDNIFVDKSAKSYLGNCDNYAKPFAIDDAKAKIAEMIRSYDYEQYLNK